MLIKCPECGKDISDKAKICPNCGVGINQESETTYQAKQPPSYQPITTPTKKKGKGCLMAILIFVGLSIICGIIGSQSTKKILPNSESGASEESKTSEEIISQITGCTVEQADDIALALYTCGADLDKLDKMEFFSDLDSGGKVYEMSTTFNNVKLMLTLNKDYSIDEINVKQKDITLYSDGERKWSIYDFYMTAEEQANAKLVAQKSIESILKSPSTAKFPSVSEWNIGRNEGLLYIQSYVDSQNSFGATIRSKFQFTIDKDGEIISLIFDGEEFIK